MTPAGLPHSEICGSRDACSSPQLIAACHVLHRLPVPRHPPCALTALDQIPMSYQKPDPPTTSSYLPLVLASFYLDAPHYLNCQKTHLIRCIKYSSVSRLINGIWCC